MLNKRIVSLLLILCLLVMPLSGTAVRAAPDPAADRLFVQLERVVALIERLSRLETREVNELLALFEAKAEIGYNAMFSPKEKVKLEEKGITPTTIRAALLALRTAYNAAFQPRITTTRPDLTKLANILNDLRSKHFTVFREAARTEGKLNLDIFIEILLTMATLQLDSLHIPKPVSDAWLNTLLQVVPPGNRANALTFLSEHGVRLGKLNAFFAALNLSDRTRITSLLQKAGVIVAPAPVPAPPGVALTADPAVYLAQLADPAVTQIVIALPPTVTEPNRQINIPVQILQAALAARKPVILDFGTARITLPPGEPLSTLLPLGATVRMQVNQLPNIVPPAGMTHAGPILEFLLHVLRDGVTTPVTAFAEPITLQIPFAGLNVVAAKMDKLGLYRQTGATWVYVGGRADKDTLQLIVELDSFSRYRIMLYEKTFPDIQRNWAQTVIEIMASRHIVHGTALDTFSPSAAITRAQTAALLVRALKLKPGSASSFTDVKSGAWFYRDVQTATGAGLLRGYPDGTFKPNQPITREEMAVILVRAARLQGRTVTVTPTEVNAILGAFTDRKSVSAWAGHEFAQAVSLRLIRGLPVNLLAPHGQTTRAEGSVMLYRLLQTVNRL